MSVIDVPFTGNFTVNRGRLEGNALTKQMHQNDCGWTGSLLTADFDKKAAGQFQVK